MRQVTLDDVARFPRPGLSGPGKISFTPDGRRVVFLWAEDGGLRRVLWELDPATGRRSVLFDPGAGVTDANVSREEALRRERQRLRETGVTHYAFSEKGALLVPLRGELRLRRGAEDVVLATGAIDPRFSPDGSRVAFVRGGELHVVEVDGGRETRLTHDAQAHVTNGLAEYVAQEEMHRHSGFWWSRDGRLLAYEQADERRVPPFVIPRSGADAAEVEEHRYPFAGAENAKVRLGVVPAAGGPTTWMDLGDAEYLARVDWHPDGRLLVQLQDRLQRRLELRAFDPATGKSALLLAEESPCWVNLHNDLRTVAPGGEILWASERSGFKQLYLLKPDGTLIRQVSPGPWPVDAVIALDAKGRRVAFTGSESPLEKHAWVAPLDGGKAERLTTSPGMHDAVFAPDFSAWIDLHDSRTSPPSATLKPSGVALPAPPATEMKLRTPELHEFASRDGVRLHAAAWLPDKLPAPLVVEVYGGPHVQAVQDSWALTVSLRAQHLADRGFVVLKVDNRGSARRGVAFESALYQKMGTVEVRDQVDGVAFARSKGWVDGGRVGIYGWSYGGYMTLMSLLTAPEVFKAGVAGAPVTSWDGYDTHYTERYMSTPRENPEGYRQGSALEHAGRLAGRLLLVHGMIDENVHFRHTARFVDALVKANKAHEILLYPNERHMPRGEKDRRNMEERIAEFFRLNL